MYESTPFVLPEDETELPLEPLSEGDRGMTVKQLQTRLAALSLYQGDITGDFDALTRQALETFQCQYGLSEMGFFGPQTWYALTFWCHETTLSIPFVSDLWDWFGKRKGTL